MAKKSVKIKGFLQKIWHTDPNKRHTNPSFAPYEPFLLGVGVVFDVLILLLPWCFTICSNVFLLFFLRKMSIPELFP